jgi:hypothetical protein
MGTWVHYYGHQLIKEFTYHNFTQIHMSMILVIKNKNVENWLSGAFDIYLIFSNICWNTSQLCQLFSSQAK